MGRVDYQETGSHSLYETYCMEYWMLLYGKRIVWIFDAVADEYDIPSSQVYDIVFVTVEFC